MRLQVDLSAFCINVVQGMMPLSTHQIWKDSDTSTLMPVRTLLPPPFDGDNRRKNVGSACCKPTRKDNGPSSNPLFLKMGEHNTSTYGKPIFRSYPKACRRQLLPDPCQYAQHFLYKKRISRSNDRNSIHHSSLLPEGMRKRDTDKRRDVMIVHSPERMAQGNMRPSEHFPIVSMRVHTMST